MTLPPLPESHANLKRRLSLESRRKDTDPNSVKQKKPFLRPERRTWIRTAVYIVSDCGIILGIDLGKSALEALQIGAAGSSRELLSCNRLGQMAWKLYSGEDELDGDSSTLIDGSDPVGSWDLRHLHTCSIGPLPSRDAEHESTTLPSDDEGSLWSSFATSTLLSRSHANSPNGDVLP
ncbi:hypothetical protein B0H13DRAFT_1879779 [Mycena leptocephala]|nr:hypothetical protein B0H13DRAFT_1879779 [Mycena leptocephala]